MVIWKVDEYVLTTFHARSGFLEDVIRCMTPWVRRTVDVRAALVANARDGTRKDQWVWMKRYEEMLVQETKNEATRFLPREEKQDERAGKRAVKPATDDEAGYVDLG